MRVCSFDLKCEQFQIDFIQQKEQKLYTMYKNENGLSSYYPIPKSQKYIMSLNFNTNSYNLELQKLQRSALFDFLAILSVVLILSILFSIYALYPLRNALLLTQEFIKDILHDFNTPLTSLRLNSSMLKKEIGESEKLDRIEQSVENILSLQQHLRSYLHDHVLEKEKFDLKSIIETQVYMLEKNYPDIKFKMFLKSKYLLANRDALTRIIGNLLTNAAKYNKLNGFVEISYHTKTNTLYIIDAGKGIKNPKRIFDRFYKEQDRGLGIGLHIVKKLCDELDIKIGVKSEPNKGSEFSLNLSKLTLQ